MSTASKIESQHSQPAAWLTRVGFGLSLALVIARVTMLEVMTDPIDISPGSDPVPRGPGAATSLFLDFVSWLPALLVLARGVFDGTFRLRVTWAHTFACALGAWTILSPLWASDKFSAAVSGFHFLSAIVFLWSASQLVRSWRRLRIVAGVCFGLLLLFGAQALSYRYIEQPELQKDWEQNGAQRLRERNLEPGTFAAKQLEGKILRREMMGFSASSNSFAAVTVMLMIITAGIVLQRRSDGASVGWIVPPLAGLAVGFAIVVWADSKTAYATPVLAAAALFFIARTRNWLARNSRFAYFAGVALFVLAAAAVFGHGLYHGSLVMDSMTFRWRYWIGAARLFAAHPLTGVGWDNFGVRYLAVRMPIAGEEIRDPHNFLVRFFAELGAIGELLAVVWMLRTWWELSRPRVPIADDAPPRPALRTLIAVTVGATLLNIFGTVDFAFASVGGDAGPSFIFLKIIERFAGALILLVGLCVACVRSLEEPTLDDRPAPWVLYSILVGLGVFLLHNLVDFSLFEIGPLFLFALLAGSAIGMRDDVDASPEHPSPVKRRLAALATVCVLWLIAGGALVVPVAIAEQSRYSADEFTRTRSYSEAAQAYHDARDTVPYNADYAFHEAQILKATGAVDRAREAYDAAIRANPAHANYHAARAALESELPHPDDARVRAEYDAALALDPANVDVRLEYAQALTKLGHAADARTQYETALWYNDQLEAVDAERLPPEKIAKIREAMAKLGA